MRPDWSEYFLAIAKVVSLRSDCRRAQVGAVIVDPHRRIVSTGYVGTAPGARGCLDGGCPRGLLSYEQRPPGGSYRDCISFHAEVNALLYSDRTRHEGGTIYITREPCFGCVKMIGASGLTWAVWDDNLGDGIAVARQFGAECG